MPVQKVNNPPNPWESTEVEYLDEVAARRGSRSTRTTRGRSSRSNDSPDLGFRYSVNPYRGCYPRLRLLLRPPDARVPELRRRHRLRPQDRRQARRAGAAARGLRASRRGSGELVVFSGVTDCYQPLEARYRLTRGCLEVCAEYRNPVGDHHQGAAHRARPRRARRSCTRGAAVRVTVSMPFWDAEQGARHRALRGHAAAAHAHHRAAGAARGFTSGSTSRRSSRASTTRTSPRILDAARGGRARRRGYVLLRLPGSVKPGLRGAAARRPCRCAPSGCCAASARRAAASSITRVRQAPPRRGGLRRVGASAVPGDL